MFEKASRLKLKYSTVRGNVTTEDLWDMPLRNNNGFCLDDLAKSLNRQIKESQEESFVDKRTSEDDITDLKFSIVKHVISVKLAEIEKAEKAAENKAKKEKIIEILADKEDSALKRKSATDLRKMLEEL